MAVPSSGQLRMLYVAKELVNGDYAEPIPDSTVIAQFPNGISLGDMSTGAGSFINDPINTFNPTSNRPDGSTPHALSEFYSYDHDLPYPIYEFNTTTNVGYYSTTETRFTINNRAFTDVSNTNNPDPIVLSNTKWRELTFRVNASQSVLYRPIIVFYDAGPSFKKDFAFNSFRINNSTLYYPENVASQYAINLSSPTIPSTWYDVVVSTLAGRFNIDEGGGTPSSGTGPDAGYVWNDFIDDYATGNQYVTSPANYWYFEASNSADGWCFWRPNNLKSISGGSTDEWKFIYSAWSDDIASWETSYFEVIIEVVGII